MNSKAIGENARRVESGMDGAALLMDLADRHDPQEAAGLGALQTLIARKDWDRAMDMVAKLILIDTRENRAHRAALTAVTVLTGDVAGVA